MADEAGGENQANAEKHELRSKHPCKDGSWCYDIPGVM
eukprot:CAMPEP_0177731552 /NCGR_PEP_ID=MMETSP0484_2-20121128/22618_1 /TAXON_ID=354590 /ORGANISM="Rhodomonas lens, Strain RHODO" /LENGTH=37 /DNA_ID= /DNA_START= /DNA_END= /DNA_ORIENTATION=